MMWRKGTPGVLDACSLELFTLDNVGYFMGLDKVFSQN